MLSRELIDLLGYAVLRKNIKMEPRNAFFDADGARQKRGVGFDEFAHLLGLHCRRSEVTGFSEAMRTKVDFVFAPNHLAAIAPEPLLMRRSAVGVHRHLQDVTTDNQKAVKEVCVQELPRFLAPLGIGMVTDEFVYVEVALDFPEYFFPCHGYLVLKVNGQTMMPMMT